MIIRCLEHTGDGDQHIGRNKMETSATIITKRSYTTRGHKIRRSKEINDRTKRS